MAYSRTMLISLLLLAMTSDLAAPLIKLDPQPPVELSSENRLSIKNNPDIIEQEQQRNLQKQEERHIPWIGLIALSGTLALLLTAKKKRAELVAKPVENPKQVALKQLQEIQEKPLTADQIYVALTTIIREYLETAFQIKVKAQTTEEFLQSLTKQPQFDADTRWALIPFLEIADAVKFGQYEPTVAEREEAIAAARKVIATK